MTTPLDLTAIEEEFLNQCGPCDYGMPAACNCTKRDYRSTMLDLVREVEQVRRGRDEALTLLDAMTDLGRKKQRQVSAAYALAAEMASYCSHLGVSAEYAARLVSRMDNA